MIGYGCLPASSLLKNSVKSLNAVEVEGSENYAW
jgi:hypothetical protein